MIPPFNDATVLTAARLNAIVNLVNSFETTINVNDTVTSVTALKSLDVPATGTIPTMVLSQYSSASNRGGGQLVWDEANASAEDLGTIFCPNALITSVTGAPLFTGNGSSVTFSGTLSNHPVNPGSVTFTAGTVTATDNTGGILSGTGVSSGTINYSTGAWSITLSSAPANALSATGQYTYCNSQGRWVRVLSSSPTLCQFGGSPSASAAVNDAAFARFGLYVFSGRSGLIEDGRYDISKPVNIPGASGGWEFLGSSIGGTVINQTIDNTPVVIFNGDLINGFDFGGFTLSHTNPQANPVLLGCGVYFDVPGTTGNGIFNGKAHDILFVNCGRCFRANENKTFPVWGIAYRNIRTQRGCTGTTFYFQPAVANGQPNNSFDEIYIFATNILPTEYSFIDSKTQESIQIGSVEVNEANLGAPLFRLTESSGLIGALKLEQGTYTTPSTILCSVANSRLFISYLLLAVSDVNVGAGNKITGIAPSGGPSSDIEIVNFQFGYTFSRLTPTSGSFYAFGGDSTHRFTIHNTNDIRSLGYTSETALVDNTSTGSAEGLTINRWTQNKFTADIGDANYTVNPFNGVNVINYAGARTANRAVTLPSTTSNDLFQGLTYTLLVGTASAFTISFGPFTFPASKTGSMTVAYRRFAWVLTNLYAP